MFINVYVANKEELDKKVQEFSMIGYNLYSMTNEAALLKKEKREIWKLLLGLILYFLWYDEYTANIQIDPNRAGTIEPNIPDPEIIPMFGGFQNTTQQTKTNNQNNNFHNGYCTVCGEKILNKDNFCPKCGNKIE